MQAAEDSTRSPNSSTSSASTSPGSSNDEDVIPLPVSVVAVEKPSAAVQVMQPPTVGDGSLFEVDYGGTNADLDVAEVIIHAQQIIGDMKLNVVHPSRMATIPNLIPAIGASPTSTETYLVRQSDCSWEEAS